ncbi:MAG: OmpA family protein [Myxococcota bacterium]|nr:OmpA family protein [Myxococcota bacterium]
MLTPPLFYSLFISQAFAGDAIGLDLIKFGQVETSNPALILKINQTVGNMDVQLNCAGKSFSKKSVSLSAGRKIKIELDIPKGKARCNGKLSAKFGDGTSGSMPLQFGIEMLPQLKIDIDRNKVDLKNKTLEVKIDRPAAEYEVEILDEDEMNVGSGSFTVPQAQNLRRQTVSWTQLTDEIAIIRVRAKDVNGFWSQTDLLPWHYDIPHEDVIFESNQSEILPAEEPKLIAVKKEIDAVFERYAKIAKANLYVAGYTDTVGAASSNQALSTRRAKEIANWFKEKGFGGKIYYQGFGESALAVPTADGVDEARNRRSLYIVAAEKPPRSADLPRSNWTLLP